MPTSRHYLALQVVFRSQSSWNNDKIICNHGGVQVAPCHNPGMSSGGGGPPTKLEGSKTSKNLNIHTTQLALLENLYKKTSVSVSTSKSQKNPIRAHEHLTKERVNVVPSWGF